MIPSREKQSIASELDADLPKVRTAGHVFECLSSFIERTAALSADRIIAVSAGMKADILRAYPGVSADKVQVIYNGIDTEEYVPQDARAAFEALGVDPKRPIALFVGRITRQKGVVHLLEAAEFFDPSIQLVLCAGAPDTPEIEAEVANLVAELSAKPNSRHWLKGSAFRAETVSPRVFCS